MNIWSRLLGRLVKKKYYPKRLLPSTKKVNSINYTSECFICRRAPCENHKMLDENGDLELFAIETVRLLNFSTNLVNKLGVRNIIKTFPNDVLIAPEDKYLDYARMPWNGIDKDVPQNIKYSVLDKGYYLLRISDFDGFRRSFPYRKNPNKEHKTTVTIEVYVKYCPMMINISHFELRCNSDITDNTMMEVKPGNSKYKDMITHVIRDRIVKEKKYYLDISESA